MKHDKIAQAYKLQLLSEEILKKPAGGVAPISKQKTVDLSDPDKNIVHHSIRNYVPDYDINQKHPESSLRKQYVIGLANRLAASGSPEYKTNVFNSYRQQHPDIVGNAANYDELVDRSYGAAKAETEHQFDTLPISTSYHQGEFDYKTSGHMVNDVHQNHHMAVYSGGEDHTHLGKTPGSDISANEKFRAVHDYYGHALHGNQFGPKGEEVAWNIHQQMYSPLAKPAVTAETRGQNSEVNYTMLNHDNISEMKKHRALAETAKTPAERQFHLDKVRKIGHNWNYARQVASVLPPEMNSPSFNGEVPESIRPLLKDSKMDEPYNIKTDHLGIHKLAKMYHPENAESVTADLAKVHGYKSIMNEDMCSDVSSEPLTDEDYTLTHQRTPHSF